MSDYLSGYGVQDSKREKRWLLIALSIVGAAMAGLVIWYFARTFTEERIVKQFVRTLESKDYQSAYALWGCTDQKPCRDYKYEKFLEDWGEKSPFANATENKLVMAEPCGNSVWVTLKTPKSEETGVTVDSETRYIGYAPEARCIGKWRASEFFPRLFRFIRERV